ncbi:MAG: CinA family protein [Bdellovibrionales bacterium]|nr:CinA family protein [Bdellovibrionales bacterium]
MNNPNSYVKKIFDFLNQRNETVCVAESGTGGLISSYLTDQEGASEFFTGGIVAYTWPVKIQQLKVPVSLLEQKGDVNAEVAQLMAKGVRSLLKADWSLSITGVMGPKNSERHELGQIFTAVDHQAFTQEEVCSTKIEGLNRTEVKRKSSLFCLDFLLSQMLKKGELS